MTTSLYDEKDLSEKKVNFYIHNQFIGQEKDIDPILSNNVSYVDLISLMKFNQFDFDKSINLSPIVNPFRESKHALVRVKDLLELQYGKPLSENEREKGDYPVMGSNGITGYHNQYLIEAPAVIVGRKGSAGKVTFVEANCFPIDTTFYVENKSNYPIKYLYYLLLALPLKDLSKSMGVPGLNRNDAHNLRVPKPDPKIVEQKIKYLDKVFEARTEHYDPKKKASENEVEFMEYFKAEIIKTFL